MQEIYSLRFRRYVLRNRANGRAIAIVEAASIIEAQLRGRLLKTAMGLFDADEDFTAARADVPMQLPTFLDSYFKLLDSA